MALSADTLRVFGDDGHLNQLPVKATSQIYKGSMVGLVSGYARALVAGDIFGGVAEEKVLGGATDGLKKVHVRRSGRMRVAVSSLAVTDIGKPVYASADDTFTLTQSTNSPIGVLIRWEETGIGIVEFDSGLAGRLSTIVALTDNSGGVAVDNTIAAVTSSATAADAITELATKLNEVINRLK
jgi:hypothetical protein